MVFVRPQNRSGCRWPYPASSPSQNARVISGQPYRRQVSKYGHRTMLNRASFPRLSGNSYEKPASSPKLLREIDAAGAALRAAGFCVTVQNQIARIDGTREKYAALLGTFHAAAPLPTDETLFLYALAQRLIRARTPIREQPVHLLGWTMKCLEMDAWEELHQRLPAQIALCQRERVPLPSAAGELIWNALTERMKGAEDGC